VARTQAHGWRTEPLRADNAAHLYSRSLIGLGKHVLSRQWTCGLRKLEAPDSSQPKLGQRRGKAKRVVEEGASHQETRRNAESKQLLLVCESAVS
jgi:hypothetical protein